eukprot:COSAG02_NODE_2751_length_8098_cov_4.799600_1_plen_38_part_10
MWSFCYCGPFQKVRNFNTAGIEFWTPVIIYVQKTIEFF